MKSAKNSRPPTTAGDTAARSTSTTPLQRTTAQLGNHGLGLVMRSRVAESSNDAPLQLSQTGEILEDEEALLAWARRSHYSERIVIAHIESSNMFSGSDAARKAAVQILKRAFQQRSLEDRRKDHDLQVSQERADYAEYEDMIRYSREQAQKRLHRERWIAGEGDLKESVLPDVKGAQLDKSNKVTFETYDATGERITLQFDTPRAFDVSAKATLEKVRKRAREVQEDVAELIRLDRKVVADTLAHATALQRAGLALPGIHLGFSKGALDLGRLATNHAAYAVKIADEQIKAFAQGLNVSGAQVNGVLRALFEAKHLQHAMVRTRESDDEATLGRLQNYSKAGDYATMVLPPPMQVALSAIKNAGMRASNMHTNNAEFGWGGFLWQTGVSIVAAKAQGRLLGPSPSFGRAFAVNVGVTQTTKVLNTGDLKQFGEMEPLDLVFAGVGAAHATRSGARPRAAEAPSAERQFSRVDEKPKAPEPHVPPALRPPTAPPKGMKGPDAEGTAGGTVENNAKLPSKVRDDTRKLAKALKPGNDATRVNRKRIVRVLLGKRGIREVTAIVLGRIEQRLGLKPGTLRGVQIKFVAKGSDSGEPNAQGWVDPKEPHVLYLALDNTSGAAVTDAAPGQPVGVYSRGGKQRTPAEEAGATTAHETDHVFSDLGHTRAAELSAMLREEKLFPTGRSVADIKRRIDRLYGELPTGDPHWWADGHAAKPANAQDDTDGVTIELTADAPDEGRQQSRMDDAGPGASHEPISPDELHAAIRSEGPALIDQSEIPFVALAGPGNGRILDIGAGSGGKALTMAGLDVRNKVHALEPYQILGEAGADEVARVDPITAQRIEFDARSAQQLVKDGMAGQYSRVNIMAPDPRLIGRANEPYQNFDAMVDSAMQLVAPGGKIALHTESDFAYTSLLQKVQQKGWMVIELKGARAVKEYIPDSHSRYAGDDKVFGGPDYYRYGLIAVRPQ